MWGWYGNRVSPLRLGQSRDFSQNIDLNSLKKVQIAVHTEQPGRNNLATRTMTPIFTNTGYISKIMSLFLLKKAN